MQFLTIFLATMVSGLMALPQSLVVGQPADRHFTNDRTSHKLEKLYSNQNVDVVEKDANGTHVTELSSVNKVEDKVLHVVLNSNLTNSTTTVVSPIVE
ncbi:BgTH12-03075 [Blumeria graminis f. sp. triticale]|uniref:BgtE-5610 n=2 Tax=Blumeria graminis TaxID=34373 RepID=A0A381LJT2_BLUGR|nr:putative secreted effector protein [Blumeria graminis f. sp. tritici 96224]CAD6503410.1 BgTH12-03075 [Blumeria graminis f. sp. triticale]